MYITSNIITLLNLVLISMSFVTSSLFNLKIKYGAVDTLTIFQITLIVIMIAELFRFLTIKFKQFSITDNWMESIKLHLLLISSIGQEIFFRGILIQILGIYLSTIIYTFWNFFPSRKRIGVIIFFFLLGLIQAQIYLYTNNILYVIYTNFLFHILIRMIKYKIL